MKRQRQQRLLPSRNTRTRFSCRPKRTTADYYLPDECWQHVFKFLNNGEDDRYLESLSLVSQQFLSITNRLLFSLHTIKPSDSFIQRLFRRFTNLTSLDLSVYNGDLDQLLCKISCFPLNLTSLDISYQQTIPAIGLRAFSQNITTLTSLTCSYMNSIDSNDLFLIAKYFPLLEELNLSYPSNFKNCSNFLNGVETLSMALSKLTKINLSGHDYINDIVFFQLFKNCKLLQEVIMFECFYITIDGITSALCERPTLRSLSLTNFKSRNFATLLALIKSYPSLSEIKLEFTSFKENSLEKSNSSRDSVVSPHLKSLCLAHSLRLGDENIKMFASIFPNLELLDLNNCRDISQEGVFHILRRCRNIKHLNLSKCGGVKLIGLNFEFPKLEVLNLSYTSVDDELLYMISKSCCGLLQLFLKECDNVTKKGVKHVLENCTQLRDISLYNCGNVDVDIVDEMVVLRPSLRKIEAPPGCFIYEKKEYFSRHGCVIY